MELKRIISKEFIKSEDKEQKSEYKQSIAHPAIVMLFLYMVILFQLGFNYFVRY